MPGRLTAGEKMKRSYSILSMPDVFLDHYLLAGRSKVFFDTLKRTAAAGSRMRADQRIQLGGNAYLFGLHAAKLGCAVTLVSRASPMMLEMVRKETAGLDFSTRYVRTADDPSLTVALEFSDGKKSSTMNLNHPGALAEFGKADFPSALSRHRFDVLSVFNFTNNSLGTELAEHVYSTCRGLRLMDLPDSASSFSDWSGLRRVVEMSEVISCSPSEVRHAARHLGLGSGSSARVSAQAIARLGPVVGVHSGSVCVEASAQGVVTTKLKELSIPSTTGAGDIWTAAYILSILRGEKPEKRLRTASAYATRMIRQRNRKKSVR